MIVTINNSNDFNSSSWEAPQTLYFFLKFENANGFNGSYHNLLTITIPLVHCRSSM